MKSIIYGSNSIRQLLDSGFEMPIHFAAVGTNGGVVAGTYQAASSGHSFECQITVQSMNPEGLTAPGNVMYVDRRGDGTAYISDTRLASVLMLKPGGEKSGVRCQRPAFGRRR